MEDLENQYVIIFSPPCTFGCFLLISAYRRCFANIRFFYFFRFLNLFFFSCASFPVAKIALVLICTRFACPVERFGEQEHVEITK